MECYHHQQITYIPHMKSTRICYSDAYTKVEMDRSMRAFVFEQLITQVAIYVCGGVTNRAEPHVNNVGPA